MNLRAEALYLALCSASDNAHDLGMRDGAEDRHALKEVLGDLLHGLPMERPDGYLGDIGLYKGDLYPGADDTLLQFARWEYFPYLKETLVRFLTTP